MKIKVQVGDEVHEVSPEAITVEGGQLLAEGEQPEGYVTTDYMAKEIKRRLSGKASRSELLSDDELFQEAAEKRGIELGEDGKPVGSEDVDVQDLRRRWEADHLKPLQQQLEEVKGELGSVLSTSRSTALANAAHEAGFKKKLAPKVASLFTNEFGFDKETKKFARKQPDGEGFAYSANQDEGNRYVTPLEHFKSLAKDPDFKDFVEDRSPGDTGLGNTNGQGGGNSLPRSAFEGLSPAQKKAHIDKGGQVVDS